MKLYFRRAELLLHKIDADFVLEMAGQEIGRFSVEKKAVSAFNRIRRELEEKMPPTEQSDADAKAALDRLLADGLVGHNSYRPPKKVAPKSRVHHT